MEPLKTDQSVFTSKNVKKKLFVAIHVDNCLMIAEDKTEMFKMINRMKNHCEIKVDENPTSYLGIQIEKRSNGLFIHQSKYVQKVVE